MEIATTRLVETLLQFFTDEGDWAYVMGYEECGIMAADIRSNTHNSFLVSSKQILITLRCGTVYSVGRNRYQRPGEWQLSRVHPGEKWGGEFTEDFNLGEIFDTFKRHARS